MTKVQTIASFREVFGNTLRGDRIMRREEWNNYVDLLCEDKKITQWQRDNWTNPF